MRVIFDMFPAEVLVIPPNVPIPGGIAYEDLTLLTNVPTSRRVDSVRIILTDNLVMIGADSPSGPMLIFQDNYDPGTLVLHKNRALPSKLRTTTDKVLVFSRGADCGCGSQLRAWNPYRTVFSSKDPTE